MKIHDSWFHICLLKELVNEINVQSVAEELFF